MVSPRTPRRIRSVRRVLAGSAAFVLASLASVLAVDRSSAASSCEILLVRSSSHSSLSVLSRVELPSGQSTELGRLDYQVNAMGYSRDQDLVYGIAGRDRRRWLGRRPHLVTIDRRGAVADLGPVREGVGGIADPTAGAVAGSRLYLGDQHRLFTMDIDPASPTYKRVLRVVRPSPVWLTMSVDDFAVSPGDGLLYGISTFGSVAKVVSIDPRTGVTRVVAAVPGVPAQDSYTSVVMTSSRSLIAIHTGHGQRTRVFRIGLDGSSTELASWSAVAGSDAAGCLRQAPLPPPVRTTPPLPPTTPPPAPPPTIPPRPPTHRSTAKSRPTPTPTPAPVTTPTPVRTPTPEPRPSQRQVLPPALELPTTPTPRPTVPPSPDVISIAPQAAAVPKPVDHTVQVLRRWSMATLLVVLTGSAAMAAQRRMRR